MTSHETREYNKASYIQFYSKVQSLHNYFFNLISLVDYYKKAKEDNFWKFNPEDLYAANILLREPAHIFLQLVCIRIPCFKM